MAEESVRVSPVAGGVLLGVRLRPRSSRAGIAGVRDGALELRVTAPPVEGEANDAARALLAGILGLPRGSVTLRSGGKSRRKVFFAKGLAPDEARARIAAARKSP